MKPFTRRDVLKTGILAPVAVVAAQGVGPIGNAMTTSREVSGPLPFSPGAPMQTPLTGTERERLLLDFGWRFHLGNADDPTKDFGFGTAGAGNYQKTGSFMPAGTIAFDDGDWRNVNLPHDWAIELPFTNDPSLENKGFYPLGRNYPANSVGWYRRVFDIPAEDAGKRVTVEFDGAYRETMVVFNGFYLGRHSGGYDPFSFDLTDFMMPGQRNVLLVRVDATESDGWFYEGAGIYRHVWLVKTNPVHVKRWGTFVRSKVGQNDATLSIQTEVSNSGKDQDVRVISTILDPSGKPVGKDATATATIPLRGDKVYQQQVVLSGPKLWSLEERNLYKLVTDLQVAGEVVDRYETPFGIRTAEFNTTNGFQLNGKPVKWKGTCNHQDHAAVGAALPDSVQYYRVAKLQEMGCNSLRTSHNPPTPELLDACDQLGMLVFDETRMMSSNPEGLQQFENLVRRDRNHPSVFMWSMGNEEGQANGKTGVRILSAMKAVANKHDGSRPVSIAPTGAIGTGGLEVGDVAGYNYMDPQALAFHKANPDKPVIGTETVSAVGTRGIYVTDAKKGYVSSYDPYTTTGRASAEGWWKFCNSQPWLSGGFVWTGFDYRGEPSPDGWGNISSQYGVIDTCGFPKDSFFYYKSWWTDKPVLHLFPHWNWPGLEGKEIAVWVYSNLDKVELFINGKSLGSKEVPKDSHVAWNVKYAPGSIEAKGYKGNKVVMTEKRETTGTPAKLVMRANRENVDANGEDVAMFAVEVQDAQGRIVPITDNEVTFTVTGAGKLLGTGNGDPTNHEPDQGKTRKAFSGLCMAVVQADKTAGEITVEAASPGLTTAKVTVPAKAVTLRPQVPVWQREVPKGSGITGVWRPVKTQGTGGFVEMFVGGDTVFTLIQDGVNLSGTVDGLGGGWFGGEDIPTTITEGKVDGDKVSFKAGNNAYTGEVKSGELDLKRTMKLPWDMPKPPAEDPNRPAVGPAPDGSDPSTGSFNLPEYIPMVLRRVENT